MALSESGRRRRPGGKRAKASSTRGLAAVGSLLVATLASGACSGGGDERIEGAAGAPVVIISIDTLRSDRLPTYGYAGVETPALDAFAGDAVTFERAYSHTPLTLPSHASILSGQLPDRHEVRDNLGYRVPGDIATYLPRDLGERGYVTGAAVSAFVLRRDTGIATGFEFFEDEIEFLEGEAGGKMSRRGEVTLAASLEWLERHATKSFFFLFHIYEPHTPWEAPEPFASRFPDPYDAEVAAADRVVGQLISELRRLGVYDRAIIFLLSDHGEGLLDHGYLEHGILLYREDLQVPLMLKLPNQQRAGSRVSADAQLVDVYPTIMELVGGGAKLELTGCSLLRLPECGGDRVVYAETFYPRLHLGWSHLQSLIQGRYHYIHGPDPELFDLFEDPAETRNVVRAERQALGGLRPRIADFNSRLKPPAAVDRETRDKLAALGYLGSSPAEPEGPLPDPKSQLPTLADLDEARVHQHAEQYEEAAAAARRAVTASPAMVDAWEILGSSLEQLGRFDEALEAYRRAIDVGGARAEILLATARVLLDLGRVDEALEGIAVARREGVVNPNALRRIALRLVESGKVDEALDLAREVAADGRPESLTALARVLSESGRQQEAADRLREALAKDREHAKAHETLGLVQLRREDWKSSEESSRRAVELDPELADAWNNLGVALYYQDRRSEALAAWEEAVHRDPSQYETLFNIGIKAPELGDLERARWALRRFIETAPAERFAADIADARRMLQQLGG